MIVRPLLYAYNLGTFTRLYFYNVCKIHLFFGAQRGVDNNRELHMYKLQIEDILISSL